MFIKKNDFFSKVSLPLKYKPEAVFWLPGHKKKKNKH
jgi:hypothetical protein